MNRRNCDGDYIASNDDSYPRKSLVERMSEDGSDGTSNNQSSTVEIVRLRDECFSPTAWDGQRRGYYMKRPTGQSGNSAIHGSKRVLIVIGAAIACAIGPGIDRFNEESGTATSTKSLDTGAKTYQSGSKLKSTLKRYINQVADFNGSDTATQSGTRVDSSMIKNRTLELVIPERGLTGEQANAINDAANYAQSTDASSQPSNPVQLIIKIGKDSPVT
jgi:hypothetical protein